jgi:hypothetical protein
MEAKFQCRFPGEEIYLLTISVIQNNATVAGCLFPGNGSEKPIISG